MCKGTFLVVLLPMLVCLASSALGQTGFYTWSVSASSTDPFENVEPIPPAGLKTLYLWFVEGCHPEAPGGMAAAEFKLENTPSWPLIAFLPMNGYLEAGPAPDPTGKNFLLAVGLCPTGPVVAGTLFYIAAGQPARIDFTETDNVPPLAHVVVTVDCGFVPVLNEWPEVMAVLGYATEGAGPHQLSGNGCTIGGPVSVESQSWGQVKALFR